MGAHSAVLAVREIGSAQMEPSLLHEVHFSLRDSVEEYFVTTTETPMKVGFGGLFLASSTLWFSASDIGEVYQIRTVLSRRAPIVRSVTQKPIGHLSLAFSANSQQVWLSVAPIWKLGHHVFGNCGRAQPPHCSFSCACSPLSQIAMSLTLIGNNYLARISSKCGTHRTVVSDRVLRQLYHSWNH